MMKLLAVDAPPVVQEYGDILHRVLEVINELQIKNGEEYGERRKRIRTGGSVGRTERKRNAGCGWVGQSKMGCRTGVGDDRAKKHWGCGKRMV